MNPRIAPLVDRPLLIPPPFLQTAESVLTYPVETAPFPTVFQGIDRHKYSSVLHRMVSWGAIFAQFRSKIDLSKPIPQFSFDGKKNLPEVDFGMVHKLVLIKEGERHVAVHVVLCARDAENSERYSRRWILRAPMSGEMFEVGKFANIADAFGMGACYAYLDYPGCGASSGPTTLDSAIKAHMLAIHLLEDPNGLGAKQIIFWGQSVGGSIQARSLSLYPFRGGVDRIELVDRAAKRLSEVVKGCGSLVRKSGWEIDLSEELPVHGIPIVVHNSSRDTVMKRSAQLQKRDLEGCREEVYFLESSWKHNNSFDLWHRGADGKAFVLVELFNEIFQRLSQDRRSSPNVVEEV